MAYYIFINGTKKGPLTLEDLYSQNIDRSTMIWKTGTPEWVLAEELPELADLLSNIPPEIPKNTNRNEKPPMPKTWLVESILVGLFLCLPFGIAGFVYSLQISSHYNSGNYEAAEEASQNAGKWTKIGFWIGIAVFALSFILPVLGGSILGLLSAIGHLL